MDVQARDVWPYRDGHWSAGCECLAVEAPLHVQVNGEAYTTTLRTPGLDQALVRGLLFTDGIITGPRAPLTWVTIADPETGIAGCIDVRVASDWVEQPVAGRRTTMATSSCGACGTRHPRDLELYGPPVAQRSAGDLAVDAIPAMMAAMRAGQRAFDMTGGTHAAAAFDSQARLLTVCEDIGRHNAVDKVVGTMLEAKRVDEAMTLTVSGRVSYEIVYKAYRAGFTHILAVSAPSSLAVETAGRFGMALAGFCRDGRATVYAQPQRFRSAAPDEARAQTVDAR